MKSIKKAMRILKREGCVLVEIRRPEKYLHAYARRRLKQ